MQGKGRISATSVPLEVVLYFGGWYDVAFWLSSLGLFVYKGLQLPYSSSAYGMEVACVLLFPIIQAVRLTAGSAGSRSEQLGPLLLMLGLSVPLIAYFVYFLFYQVYVLRIDQILCGIGMAFVLLQVAVSFAPLCNLLRSPLR